MQVLFGVALRATRDLDLLATTPLSKEGLIELLEHMAQLPIADGLELLAGNAEITAIAAQTPAGGLAVRLPFRLGTMNDKLLIDIELGDSRVPPEHRISVPCL